MSTTSKKSMNFCNAPMGKKPVIEVAGIGKASSDKLKKVGIIRACQLYGMYLFNCGEASEFKTWLHAVIPGSKEVDVENCYNCLNTFHENFW